MQRSERQPGLAPALLLTGLVALAFALRFWRLGEWNFQATEIFTLRDSLHPKLSNPRPLGYALNYFLVRPLMPLDEFGMRFLPAIFGGLAVPAVYLVGRRLLGTRAAWFAAILLTLSPLLILYSQLARYWSLVFLLCAIYPYAVYLGIRDRDARMLILGVLAGILAVLAHPVSILLLGGLGIWLVLTYFRTGRLMRLWNQPGVRWGVAVAAVLAALLVLRLIPVLHGWISSHDRNPGSGQFLLRPKAAPGMKQVFYVSALVESLTVPLVLAALAGTVLVWRRDRPLALLLVCLAAFQIGFLSLISLRTPVSTYYLLPAIPVFFLTAGVFIAALFDVESGAGPGWVLPTMLVTIVVATGLPTLLSDYRDGRRYDFRQAAAWLEPRLTPNDVVFSDQPIVLTHYLPRTRVQRLRSKTEPLEQSSGALTRDGRGGALWIVAPAPSHALRANLKAGGLSDWIYDHCQLRSTLGVGRVDFRQEYLQIYRCPPAPPGALRPQAAAAGGAAATP